MKYKWLNQKNNLELIIFFNGWGMDENIVKHLEFDSYDVLMFYDYNSLKTDFDMANLKKYSKKYLVAWSMGVMTATLFDIDYTAKTAVNGTLYPIDDKFGIPTKIYNLTVNGFSPIGAKKFIKNMFKENCELPDIERDFENQKSELEALKHYKANTNFRYDRIILSTDDKIIPTRNQKNFWGIEPNTNSGHAPFNHFKKWGELI